MDARLLRATAPFRDDPSRSAILLDLDGTLAPIVPDPAAVAIPAQIRLLLPQLRDSYRVVAIVSGRSYAQLRAIVDIDGLVYSGNHGHELVDRTGRLLPDEGFDLKALRRFAAGWVDERLAERGVWLEDKVHTLTFHYRNAPDPLGAEQYLARKVAPLGEQAGLRVEAGRMSLEVHPAGDIDKGAAVMRILDGEPQVVAAISLGDDRTDTTVWRALRQACAAGRLHTALAVGIQSDETPQIVRDSADLLVEGVAGSLGVLSALVPPHRP